MQQKMPETQGMQAAGVGQELADVVVRMFQERRQRGTGRMQ